MNAALLEVRDLTVSIGGRKQVVNAVDGVSFDVRAGESVGLVGESGCGKTTTGLALMRLTAPAMRLAGQILFDGRDVLQFDDAALRAFRGRDISMVLQDPQTSLNPVLAIGEQVAEAVATHEHLDSSATHARVIDALRRVRIAAPEARVANFPHQLSGGMQQRVVGAVALACRPRLLIADEPTTALDVTVQAQYLQLLDELRSAQAMALLLITHDLGVVARACDRVCVMYAGQIVESAPVRELFRRPAHWYTAALLGSVPTLARRSERLVSIPGTPPRPGDTPAGCRFAPRCQNAQPRCQSELPPATSIDARHVVRCWFPRTEW